MKYKTYKSGKAPKITVDPWDTDSVLKTLQPVILALLVQLRSTQSEPPFVDGYDVPSDIEDDSERWAYVLQTMIEAFEQALEENTIETNKNVDLGLRLFSKYFLDLVS